MRNPQKDKEKQEIDFGRVVGIVKKEGKSVNSNNVEYYLEYHVEFGYTATELSNLSSIKVIGKGTKQTSIMTLDEILRYV